MSEVKRYDPIGYDRLSGYMQQHPEGDYVRHADYAALEAECARLKNSLLAIAARRFAEGWKKRTSDADLEQYLSAGIAQLEAERDALEDECERLRVKLMTIASAEPARHGIEWAKAIAAEGNSEPYAKWREAIEERDALAAELAAIKGQQPVAFYWQVIGYPEPHKHGPYFGWPSESALRNVDGVAITVPLYTLPAAPEGGEKA